MTRLPEIPLIRKFLIENSCIRYECQPQNDYQVSMRKNSKGKGILINSQACVETYQLGRNKNVHSYKTCVTYETIK